MFKYLSSILLIGASVAIFMLVTNPIYTNIGKLKADQTDYNQALSNSKTLGNERDRLTAEYNAISPKNLAKIKKLLPDNVDNIRLVLEIEKMALPYGMVLKDVLYSPVTKETKDGTPGVISGGGSERGQSGKNYGSWDLAFSTSGTYSNFLNFTRDLESNLRIVDISSIQFASAGGAATSSGGPEVYKFSFKIKTYWLKN